MSLWEWFTAVRTTASLDAVARKDEALGNTLELVARGKVLAEELGCDTSLTVDGFFSHLLLIPILENINIRLREIERRLGICQDS